MTILMSTDSPPLQTKTEERLINWFFRPKNKQAAGLAATACYRELTEDWATIGTICGHDCEDFRSSSSSLPLTASEINYFCRNHRNIDRTLTNDFFAANTHLPAPLSALYVHYRQQARMDAEATFFVAQATGSTRVAHIMADLTAVGSFAKAMDHTTHITMTYANAAAFDTSDLIDRANQEAARRLALPIDHPAHLLTLTPDEIGILAANIIDRHLLSQEDFLEKANLLAEARQDVNRLPKNKQFVTAIGERDLLLSKPWVSRICSAYARLFEDWVLGLPEIAALITEKKDIHYQ